MMFFLNYKREYESIETELIPDLNKSKTFVAVYDEGDTSSFLEIYDVLLRVRLVNRDIVPIVVQNRMGRKTISAEKQNLIVFACIQAGAKHLECCVIDNEGIDQLVAMTTS